jgi:hypothetical protein
MKTSEEFKGELWGRVLDVKKVVITHLEFADTGKECQ